MVQMVAKFYKIKYIRAWKFQACSIATFQIQILPIKKGLLLIGAKPLELEL
jgi:hypothetical protein